MSVDGREEPYGGVGGEVEAGDLPARQVPAQREPGGRHAAGASGELPPSDGDLIARMRGGDDGAYEELFRRHADAVRRYARTCCRDGHTADDLTAEVFARTLQAVRGGAGPDQSVRAYLLTTVRRVAAAWAKTAKREHLVEDFALFAEQASASGDGGVGLAGDDTLELGADVRAMHEAEQSLAMQAFRSLPERWQAVLWHTTVEEASPSAIAPLFGLSANATAVLASRAREGLKQAYLQAHVSTALSSGGDCARYADRLGAYARGGLRMRAERGLRKHLEECARCRVAARELKDVNAGIPALLPIAVIGWFAAGYAAKAAGVVAGGAVAAGGAGAAAGGSTVGVTGAGTAGGAAGGAAASGAAGTGGAGGAGGALASEGLGLPAKAAIAAGVVVAAAAGVVFALAGDDAEPPASAKPAPSMAAPIVPAAKPSAPASQEPSPTRAQPAPARVTTPPAKAPAAPAPSPSRVRRSASPGRSQSPGPSPRPTPRLKAPPKPAPAAQAFRIARLGRSAYGDHDGPEIQTWQSSWVWQRWGLRIGGQRFAHGITVDSRSSVQIALNRQCTDFTARAGVDGLSLYTDGEVRFSVYGDGQRLWRSAVIGREDPAASVSVSLSGHKTLRLVVERVGSGSLPVLASWVDAVISCR
ncbi:sigma-70 family RNA polymerase sigma factor [Streptomyces sp. ISL-66]|uniref:sigma-70 family RNA polymerase sigma factor n=1 Tax=Streptomyces sp. ISL-66 TaxID=2819186 RepID=UPI001BE718E9|nr:sigma-70 family RNA polymerase sigma factor [Streptomyces sp. ISL-66]MBT2468761.1 sigma-70 family RNA polymerase sigma factor [Streptomyces sp. ISL-66]